MYGRFLNIEVLSIVISILINVLVNDDVIMLIRWDRSGSGAWTTGNGRRKVLCL